MGFLNQKGNTVNASEMKLWETIVNATPADEVANFNAQAILESAGAAPAAAADLLHKWAGQAGHRIVAVGDGLFRWDFGPGHDGHAAAALPVA